MFTSRNLPVRAAVRHHWHCLSLRDNGDRAGAVSPMLRPAAGRQDGKPIGSTLIGQKLSDPKYFWAAPRPPAAAQQRHCLGRIKPGTAEPGDVEAVKADRCPQGNRSGQQTTISPPTCRSFRQRPRSAYQSGGGRVPGRAASPASASSTSRWSRRSCPPTRKAAQLGVFGEPRINVLKMNSGTRPS